MNINFAGNYSVEFVQYNHHAARRHTGNEGIKPQRHKDTELHFVLLRAAVVQKKFSRITSSTSVRRKKSPILLQQFGS